MCPRGEVKILWSSEESVGYEICLQCGKREGELQIGVPKAVAHHFNHRERVKVIIEKIKEK